MQYDLNVIPLFHPKDRIYAIQTREALVGDNAQTKYILVVKQEDGTKVCKEVTEEWLKTAIEPEIYDHLIENKDKKGWVILVDGNPALIDVDDDDL